MKVKIYETLWIIFIDSIAIALSFSLAYLLRLGTFYHSLFPFGEYIQIAFSMIPLWIFLLAFSGRYSLKEKILSKEIQTIILSSLAASSLFPLLFYFKQDLFFSRGIIILLFFSSIFFLFTISVLYKKYTEYCSKHNIGISKMLVIGAGKNAENIIANLLDEHSRHKPVAILTPYGSKKKEISEIPVLGKLDSLERVFNEYKIHELFLCEAVEHSENLASFCQNKGVVLRTSLETLGINHSQIETETIGNTTFLTLQQSPLFGWGQFLKRLFDIIFSLFFLILFSPYIFYSFFIAKNVQSIAFKNGIDSIFYGYISKNNNTLLNTLLLFISVLQKNCSIVGPQLITQEKYEKYFKNNSAIIQSRFILRPGIFSPISLTQNTDIIITTKKEIKYIRDWSFWKDCRILCGKINR